MEVREAATADLEVDSTTVAAADTTTTAADTTMVEDTAKDMAVEGAVLEFADAAVRIKDFRKLKARGLFMTNLEF